MTSEVADVIPIELVYAAKRYLKEQEYHISTGQLNEKYRYTLHDGVRIAVTEIIGDSDEIQKVWNAVLDHGDHTMLRPYMDRIPSCVLGVQGGCKFCRLEADPIQQMYRRADYARSRYWDGSIKCKIFQFPGKKK